MSEKVPKDGEKKETESENNERCAESEDWLSGEAGQPITSR